MDALLRTMCLLVFCALALLAGPAADPLFAEEGWVPLGPPGGEVMELLVHPRNPRVLWAATRFGGIYRSVDGGASWNSSNQGLPRGEFRALALSPSDPGTLYVALGNVPVEVFRSSDGGRTWTVVLACRQNPFPCCGCVPLAGVWDLFVHPRNSQTVLATTQRGVFKSVDGGRQWRRLSAGPLTLAFDPRNPQIVYGGASGGVLRSTNGGASWSAWNTGMEGIDIRRIVIDPRNPRRMWAGGPDGVYRSTDAGAHWRRSGSNPDLVNVESLALSPGGGQGDLPTVWAGAFFGLFRSLDGGVTWTRSRDLQNRRVVALAAHPSQPAIVWAGAQRPLNARASAGIYKSVNGGASWVFSSQGIFETFATDLAFDPVTPGVLWAASASGISRSTDGGATWTERGHKIPAVLGTTVVAVDPRDPQTVWAGTNRGVFVTEDAGVTWEARREGLSGPGAQPFAPVQGLWLATSDPSIAYARTNIGLFRTADAGAHWTLLPRPSTLAEFGLEDVLVDPRDPDLVFIAWDDLWVSRNGGSSWEKLDVGSGSANFFAVAADPRDPDVIYAGSEEGVFRSSDGGETWQRVTEIPVTYEGDLAVSPTGEVWAATRWDAIYRSPDGVSGWTPIPDTDQFFNLFRIEIDPHAPHDAFAVTGSGIFRHTEGD